jgi:hypothetical protein
MLDKFLRLNFNGTLRKKIFFILLQIDLGVITVLLLREFGTGAPELKGSVPPLLFSFLYTDN